MALEPVSAPIASPPRYSLLAAASVVDNGDRWQGGFRWSPEQCGVSGAMPADCASADREPGAAPPADFARPFYVWASDDCSTWGFSARDWQGRARRQLEATQSFQVAAELWTGAITRTLAEDQRTGYLTDPDTVVGAGASTVFDTVVRVETWAARASQGRRQMVHMSPLAFATFVQEAQQYVLWSGNVAVTMRGTIVVTDDGYPGTQPRSEADDGNEWVISSPLVAVRLDTVEILPGSFQAARDLAIAVAWDTNHVTVWAQRLAAYQLETCGRFAAPLPLARNLSTPPTPTS